MVYRSALCQAHTQVKGNLVILHIVAVRKTEYSDIYTTDSIDTFTFNKDDIHNSF